MAQRGVNMVRTVVRKCRNVSAAAKTATAAMDVPRTASVTSQSGIAFAISDSRVAPGHLEGHY